MQGELIKFKELTCEAWYEELAFWVNYHLYCVLAFSQRSFGASEIHKVGPMTRVLDTTVLFALSQE